MMRMKMDATQPARLACVILIGAGLAHGAYAGASASAGPEVFASGVISGPANDAATTFSPDGRTVYFFRSNGEDYDIMLSRREGVGHWSKPVIAPFSGHWRDLEPAMAPDGSYLVFASSRPIDGGNRAIDGHWGGSLHAGRGGHLWRVDRQRSGWSKPELLPDTVNHWDSTFSPAVASDGSLYFMAATGKRGRFQLYCAAFRNGAYQTPQLLPFSAGDWGGVDPAIAPDQSFIVFASNRPPTPVNGSDVFIAFRDGDGRWSKPADLRPFIGNADGIDELRLGSDGHTLYFTTGHIVAPAYPKTLADSERGLQQMRAWNNGKDNVWKIDLAPWLRRNATASIRAGRDRPH